MSPLSGASGQHRHRRHVTRLASIGLVWAGFWGFSPVGPAACAATTASIAVRPEDLTTAGSQGASFTSAAPTAAWTATPVSPVTVDSAPASSPTTDSSPSPASSPTADPHTAPASTPSPAGYRALADEFDRHFREILRLWFPRCVDPEGGFFENFGSDWSRRPSATRFLVFQGRMTWVAAEAAGYVAAAGVDDRTAKLREQFLGHARHGLKFLNEVMRDRDRGGVYYRVRLEGPDRRPVDDTGGEKHAYGLSFAIYAASAVYRETKDPAALELAKDTFLWLESHAHDSKHGGYFESLSLEGSPRATEAPWSQSGRQRSMDGIGTLMGFKTMNSHIHLLEALTALYLVWPEPKLRERMEEMLALVRDRIAVEPGCLNLFLTPDWRPVPAHDSFGHDIETAYLLVEAAEALGRGEDASTWRVARGLVDHALEWGFDEEYGGFYDKGEAFAPAHDTAKVWWTQAEGLNALVLMHRRFGKETTRYWEAALKQWKFIVEHQIDPVHGEWHGYVSREGKVTGGDEKASPWKAAYHNGRALMNSARMLQEMGLEAR